ncbi:MAG: hypothetical protein EOP04_14970 [Proteobacteria bacterium]|nr:MAG: hypothetical protein EOP04_14970 [Pseudomonadota bacterium]
MKHRCNTISDLDFLDRTWGVEIDLRSELASAGKLHLSHDAWIRGEDFERWLSVYSTRKQEGPLILNTKEDGLESRILELVRNAGIKNYFFLDTALPTLIKWSTRENLRAFAVRWSNYEPAEFVQKFAGLCDWVWVDCFGGVAPPETVVRELTSAFKVCLVSPELQTGDAAMISEFLSLKKIGLAAVCTKQPQAWLTE